SILRHIPKGARNKLAISLGNILKYVVDNQLLPRSWNRLLGFANACLAKPSRGGKSHNLTSLILAQCRAFHNELIEDSSDINLDRITESQNLPSVCSKPCQPLRQSKAHVADADNLESKRATRAS